MMPTWKEVSAKNEQAALWFDEFVKEVHRP